MWSTHKEAAADKQFLHPVSFSNKELTAQTPQGIVIIPVVSIKLPTARYSFTWPPEPSVAVLTVFSILPSKISVSSIVSMSSTESSSCKNSNTTSESNGQSFTSAFLHCFLRKLIDCPCSTYLTDSWFCDNGSDVGWWRVGCVSLWDRICLHLSRYHRLE